ncbi:MAG: hypothetical protein GY929_22080 [Actinomycetia bacterium]|nr:hypothetical protein [Actinomycetes bacterium]
MDLRIDDKVAIVTGGSRDIGLAFAKEFATSGGPLTRGLALVNAIGPA